MNLKRISAKFHLNARSKTYSTFSIWLTAERNFWRTCWTFANISTKEQVSAKRDFLKNISSYSKLRAKWEQKKFRVSKYILIYTTIERLELLLHLVGTCYAAFQIQNSLLYYSEWLFSKPFRNSKSRHFLWMWYNCLIVSNASTESKLGLDFTLNFNATKHNFVPIFNHSVRLQSRRSINSKCSTRDQTKPVFLSVVVRWNERKWTSTKEWRTFFPSLILSRLFNEHKNTFMNLFLADM